MTGPEVWSDLITPERAAKGDMSLTRQPNPYAKQSFITKARVEDRSVLGLLIDKGHLDEHHRYYGDKLLECRHAFLSPVRHRPHPMGHRGGAESTGFAAALYVRVTARLTGPRVRTVLYALAERDVRPAIGDLPAAPAVYRDAFERLVDATDEERKRLHDELANNPCANP